MNGSEFDDKILSLAAEEKSVNEIASTLAISTQTVYARFRDPFFAARLAEKKGKRLSRAAFRTNRMMTTCLDALEGYIDGTIPASPKDRLAAIKITLDTGFRLRQEADYAPRMAAIEALLKEKNLELPLQEPYEESDPGDD